MAILNLTQHSATPDQIAAGVVDLPADARAELIRLMTFTEPPDGDDITPVFAFSVRDTEERAQPDGTVAKTTVFRHAGFVVGVAI